MMGRVNRSYRIRATTRGFVQRWAIVDEATGDQIGDTYSTADDAQAAIGFAALVTCDVLQEVAPPRGSS